MSKSNVLGRLIVAGGVIATITTFAVSASAHHLDGSEASGFVTHLYVEDLGPQSGRCAKLYNDPAIRSLLPNSPRRGFEIVQLPGSSNPNQGETGFETANVDFGGNYKKTLTVTIDILATDHFRWSDTTAGGPDDLTGAPGAEVAMMAYNDQSAEVYIGLNMLSGELMRSPEAKGKVNRLDWCYVSGPCGIATRDDKLAACAALNDGFTLVEDQQDLQTLPVVDWFRPQRTQHSWQPQQPLNVCGCTFEMRRCDKSRPAGTKENPVAGSCNPEGEPFDNVVVEPSVTSGQNTHTFMTDTSDPEGNGVVGGTSSFGF